MKLRIRSTETKETLKIETSDPSTTLDELKTLIASKLSSSSIPFPPQSIRLSLNRVDELLSPTPESPLHSLGLTSGDLLFFSLLPLDSKDRAAETLESDSNPTQQVVNSDAETLDSQSFLEGTSSENDLMDTEMELPPSKKLPLVPCFLTRVMEMEKGEINGELGLLVVAVHAVFLESGFVVYSSGGDGSRLPQNWGKLAPSVSFQYSLPELAGPHGARDMKVAVLKFSAMGNYVSIYGFVGGDSPDVYRVCLDVPKLVSCLVTSWDSMGEREENDVFKIWKIVKDELCLPLLIDICEKNGLPLPPCFARLPTELKLKIFELLTGVDVANLGCTCTELRYLSLTDEIWRQKFLNEFGLLPKWGVIGSSWRDKFARCWLKKKNANERPQRESMYRMPNIFAPRYNPFAPQRIPVIGGDYDMFPAGGGFGLRGPRIELPCFPARRNFSPQCNLGAGSDDFSM